MSDQHDFSPVRAIDENGLPVPGAEMRAFIPGTMAPVDIYADADETILHPIPLLANGAGVFPAVWCSNPFKAEVKSPAGVMLPGYPMEVAMRSFGGVSAATGVSFAPTADIVATNVQDAIEAVFSDLSGEIGGLGDLAQQDQVTTALFDPAALRTAAEGVASPQDTEVPTVSAMVNYVAGQVAPKANTAPDLVLGPFPLALADARTNAHGFGALPRKIEFVIICNTASAGLAVGDRYGPITATAGADGANVGFGAAANATNVKTVTGQANITILNMGTGGREALAGILGNFTYEIRVWR
jgi:hypothetical protein